MSETNTRLVKCIKLGEDLPGLPKPPFPGEMGKKIFDSVSQKAWDMWKDMQIKILNEKMLENSGDPAMLEKI